MRPTWAEVHLETLKANVRELLRLTAPGAVMMAVVKASAYGHGAVPAAKACLEAGAEWLGVALMEEALELRASGIEGPLMVLGGVSPEAMRVAVKMDVGFPVFSGEHVRQAAAASRESGRAARVHLKVDTGMGRIGARVGSGMEDLIQALKYTPGVHLEGTFTHFACADWEDLSYTRRQFEIFQGALRLLEEAGLDPGLRHTANSAACLDLPWSHLDMTRPGLSLYGYYPSQHLRSRARLEPCLEWKTRTVQVKVVPGGELIGYGSTHRTPGDRVIATVPVGYADGYSRAFSNRGEVLVKGKRVPVIGRVCMDQMMLDLGVPGSLGDPRDLLGETVVLLGRQGDERITADDLASGMGTIAHEVLTRIGERVPRVHL
ncbi:MAG: alanine racemase [Bacillota bacterium]